MFRVLAVDDEPSALAFLCQIVEKRCPGFEIVGRASNGRECLDMLEETRPDVVLSDIKMPVMDGIALAKAMREAYPKITLLLISGYQEFDYARSALKYGVADYLLKPLVPSQLAEVFARLRAGLEQQRLERRNRVLRRMFAHEAVEAGELERCFPERLYRCALIRRNGLPKRFTQGTPPEAYEAEGDSISLFGRDDMERVYLCPTHVDIVGLSRDVVRRQKDGGDYYTAVCTSAPFPIDMLPNALRRLYRALEEATILGVTQVLSIDWTEIVSKGRKGEDGEDFITLEHYLNTGDAVRARREFERLMCQWEAARIPQLVLERRLRYVLFLCARMDSARHLKDVGEHLLDDAFYHIVTMAEMRDYMVELIFPEAIPGEMDVPRVDSPEQFERIRGYVLANLAEPLSLESLSRRFGISQSYISKLFRKYEEQSFNTFLTETRMERACAILRAQPDTLVKDVALMVGYADAFYFSRCFRAHTGMSPRDYTQAGMSE